MQPHGAQVDRLLAPGGDGLVDGDDEEPDRAAEATPQHRDVLGPGGVLLGVFGELHLDDDRQLAARGAELDDEVGAVFGGSELGEGLGGGSRGADACGIDGEAGGAGEEFGGEPRSGPKKIDELFVEGRRHRDEHGEHALCQDPSCEIVPVCPLSAGGLA
ncbi:MAG: hypothetical protein HY905_01095 [Deltaproteobacteria bacterium]|nr:hypothetical protein [Deltaproteobacteria bacterium]